MRSVNSRCAATAVLALCLAVPAAAQQVVPGPARHAEQASEPDDDAGQEAGAVAAPDPESDAASEAPADAGSADDTAQAAQASEQEAREAAARSQIQTLGEGTDSLTLVRHPGTWSMYADTLSITILFGLWHGVGGPVVSSKVPFDFPFTMTVHRMSGERIVARVLANYSYTLHYENGRLAQVHVLSANPARSYKTPRLVESRKHWTDAEVALLTAEGPGH